MKKSISLLLVVLLVSAMIVPVLAFTPYQDGIPDLDFDDGPYRGFNHVYDYFAQGGTLTLQDDLILHYSFGIEKDTVLDLNGHTITAYTSDYHYSETNVYHRSEWIGIVSGANVTIKNGTLKDMQLYLQPDAHLTLENVTLVCSDGKDPRIENNGVIEKMVNCTLVTENEVGNPALKNYKSGTIKSMENCEINVDWGMVFENYGKIGSINNCRFFSNKWDTFLFNAADASIGTMSNCIMYNETGHIFLQNRGAVGTIENCIRRIPAGYSSPAVMDDGGSVGKEDVRTVSKLFKDIPLDKYYMQPVYWALENEVTTGRSSTTFDPTSTCTRGEVVTFLWRAMGEPEPKTTENPFADVKETEYYYKPILWAVENGITNGTTATTFSPNQTCSNAHILTFLYRTMGELGKTGTGAWYADAEAWAKKADLLDQTGAEVSLTNGCPRCDVVTFLYRVLEK